MMLFSATFWAAASLAPPARRTPSSIASRTTPASPGGAWERAKGRTTARWRCRGYCATRWAKEDLFLLQKVFSQNGGLIRKVTIFLSCLLIRNVRDKPQTEPSVTYVQLQRKGLSNKILRIAYLVLWNVSAYMYSIACIWWGKLIRFLCPTTHCGYV